MTHSILHIDASLQTDASVSRGLTRDVVAKFTAAHPDAKVTYRDLAKDPVREIDGAWMAAVNTPADQRDETQAEIATNSDVLISEVKSADTVVIGLPVYNFGVPSQIKAWLDQLARAGETFKYTENGPVGLIENTRAIVVFVSGGTPFGAEIDFASGYVRHMLGFLGITEVEFVVADKGMIDPEASKNAANQAVLDLVA